MARGFWHGDPQKEAGNVSPVLAQVSVQAAVAEMAPRPTIAPPRWNNLIAVNGSTVGSRQPLPQSLGQCAPSIIALMEQLTIKG